MRYLSLQEVISLHSLLIAQSGGSSGLRDQAALESAVAHPEASFGGEELYRDLASKAAALGHSLIQNHSFVDGNKPIGHGAMEIFLMDITGRVFIIASLILISITFNACGVRGNRGPSGTAPILLFNGTGTSPGDVEAVEAVLKSNHHNYSTVDSSQLNEMSESQLRTYRLLIVPGGNFIEIGNGLTASTTTNIRNAVHNGLNYLGICAGGFFAGDSGYNSLNLTSGVRFRFYTAEDRGIHKAVVAITIAGAPTLDHYWEDGPEFTGWGAVIGKYPDGTPAIVEGTFGSGWVLLTGVHPEAPENWRRGMTFNTPATVDNAYAATLIHAALNQASLSH